VVPVWQQLRQARALHYQSTAEQGLSQHFY
jgi:hypothetical protein